MKNEFKFILSVIGIILSSVLLLTGCMAAITSGADSRPYRLSTIPQTIVDEGSGSITETVYQQPIVTPDLQEPPVSQEELKAKFSAIYDFSQGNKTVSVISEAYLEDYWSGNKVNYSLSIPEVLYIIQDSISLYNEYDTIILPGLSSNPAIREQQTITPHPDDRDQAREDVRKIIAYRLRALSSPNAFFTVAEMMEYRKVDLASVPDLCREVFFYIPNYSADTNRNLYLSDANYSNSRSRYGVFCFSYFNRMVLFNSGNPETVFPTKELSLEVQDDEVIYLEMRSDWIFASKYYDTLLGVPSFVFNPEKQTFYITTIGAHYDSEKNRVVLEKDCPDFKKWPGTYEKIGNRLYLYPFDIPNTVYAFDCGADGALIFNKGASKQMELTFEDQSLYQPIDPNP